MTKRNLLIASTSTVYGKPYLSYMKDDIIELYRDTDEIVFIPFARPSGMTWDEYTAVARKFFSSIGIRVRGIHEFSDMRKGLKSARGVFTGGGNSFVLLNDIYAHGLMDTLREKIAGGMPYMGTSAGSNILGKTIGTTNDMPIVYPPTFDAIGAIPFNINPHYLDPDPDSKHMGETRETRILEFLVFNKIIVTGIREGGYFRVKGNNIQLLGDLNCRIFEQGKDPYEIAPGSNVAFLLEE